MGLTSGRISNDYNPSPRQKMQHVDLTKRFKELHIEVELGFTAEQTAREVQRCLNCDIADRLHAPSSASSATPASTSARCSA